MEDLDLRLLKTPKLQGKFHERDFWNIFILKFVKLSNYLKVFTFEEILVEVNKGL